MSNIVRKYERNILRKQIKDSGSNIKKAFPYSWREYRNKKYIETDKDGNIVSDNTPKNTMRKKQRHFDNKEQYFNLFSFVDNMRNTKTEDLEQVEEKE